MTVTPPKAGWLKPLLVASLMLNILVVGAIAGRAYVHARDGGWRGADGVGAGLLALARSLPSDRAKLVRDVLREERPKVRALRLAAQEARTALSGEIAAADFDAARVRAAAVRSLDADRKIRETLLDAMVRVAEKLTPAERAMFAEKMRARHRAWSRRQGDDGPGDANK